MTTKTGQQRTVLVTGANGFIGRAMVTRLLQDGCKVRAALRRPCQDLPTWCEQTVIGEITAATDWSAALDGVTDVVHLAARVHETDGRGILGALFGPRLALLRTRAAARLPAKVAAWLPAPPPVVDPLEIYRVLNRDGTRRLAEAAAAAGVRRFLFVSSVKAMADEGRERPLIETDSPTPQTPYGRSKLEAEAALAEVAVRTGLDLVIVRPPLVYGPGVKANFLSLLHLAERNPPLPLAGIDNRRSMVFLDNLTDALSLCLRHPAASGRTFLISDGVAASVPQLLRELIHAFGHHPRLFFLPPALLERIIVGWLGARDIWHRVAGSLVVDDSALRTTLGWRPVVTREEGLAQTVAWYLLRRS